RARPASPRGASGAGQGTGGAAVALAGAAPALSGYAQFEDVVALIRARRDMALLYEVETCLRLVRYSPGRIEFEPTSDAAPDLAQRLGARLQSWTGARWGVSVTQGGGATLAERHHADQTEKAEAALDNPVVAAVFQHFPRARIREVRALRPATPEPEPATAQPPVEDDSIEADWDPFEDT
ncbi:MAG: DNA polymerase III subunit gamma/tau, partial [Rhodobacteraceae bacterium]